MSGYDKELVVVNADTLHSLMEFTKGLVRDIDNQTEDDSFNTLYRLTMIREYEGLLNKMSAELVMLNLEGDGELH